MYFFTLNNGDLIWRSVTRDIRYSLLMVLKSLKYIYIYIYIYIHIHIYIYIYIYEYRRGLMHIIYGDTCVRI